MICAGFGDEIDSRRCPRRIMSNRSEKGIAYATPFLILRLLLQLLNSFGLCREGVPK